MPARPSATADGGRAQDQGEQHAVHEPVGGKPEYLRGRGHEDVQRRAARPSRARGPGARGGGEEGAAPARRRPRRRRFSTTRTSSSGRLAKAVTSPRRESVGPRQRQRHGRAADQMGDERDEPEAGKREAHRDHEEAVPEPAHLPAEKAEARSTRITAMGACAGCARTTAASSTAGHTRGRPTPSSQGRQARASRGTVPQPSRPRRAPSEGPPRRRYAIPPR